MPVTPAQPPPIRGRRRGRDFRRRNQPGHVPRESRDKITVGLIGCGHRGQWIADLFKQNGNYDLVACADYFQDRVDTCGEKFAIPAGQRYTGLSGYRRMLDGKVDAVVIESPPYFHPRQAADAVAAGKHVYLAKPVAVDVPGCQLIAESGKQATAKKQAFLVDFQTRANELYQKAVQRVHEGAIGNITFGELLLPLRPDANARARRRQRLESRLSQLELRQGALRRHHYRAKYPYPRRNELDHAGPPLHVIGSGGRKVRMVGDCWDHFSLLFQYPDDVAIVFTSKQYDDHASDAGIIVDIFGSLGRISTKYGGAVMLLGKNKEYLAGKTGTIFQAGVVANIAALHKMITTGDFANPTVAPGVQSNIITIMGRTAAYQRRLVTWNEIVNCTERLDAKLSCAKSVRWECIMKQLKCRFHDHLSPQYSVAARRDPGGSG